MKKINTHALAGVAVLMVASMLLISFLAPSPAQPARETQCDDGIDNDNDGKIDCDDPTNCKNTDPVCTGGGGGNAISPVFTVSPDILHTDQVSDALLCVHNGNDASNTNIEDGDAFSFTLDPTCATVFVPNGASPVVTSTAFGPANFAVDLHLT